MVIPLVLLPCLHPQGTHTASAPVSFLYLESVLRKKNCFSKLLLHVFRRETFLILLFFLLVGHGLSLGSLLGGRRRRRKKRRRVSREESLMRPLRGPFFFFYPPPFLLPFWEGGSGKKEKGGENNNLIRKGWKKGRKNLK